MKHKLNITHKPCPIIKGRITKYVNSINWWGNIGQLKRGFVRNPQDKLEETLVEAHKEFESYISLAHWLRSCLNIYSLNRTQPTTVKIYPKPNCTQLYLLEYTTSQTKDRFTIRLKSILREDQSEVVANITQTILDLYNKL